jgi:signal transduction histidine kinase
VIPIKTRSLARQTVLIVLLAQLVCAAILCGATLVHEHQIRFKAFDTRLQGRSDSLLGAIQDAEDPGDNVAIDPSELSIPPEDVYAVYNQGGALLGTSANAPPALIARTNQRLRTVRIGDTSYRVLERNALRVIDRAETSGIGLRRPVTILYAAPEGNVWHQTLQATSFYLITTALAAFVAVLLVSLLLRRALRPLSDLSSAAAKVSAPALAFEAPASALQIRELQPLAHVLLDVLTSLRASFAKEQRFVGDAAHELKTALAVVRSSVQVLMLKRRTEDEYATGLERILEDTHRVEALVAQMLQLASTEEGIRRDLPPVNLSEIVLSVAEKLRPVALSHEVDVHVQPPVQLPAQSSDPLLVRLPPEAAEILVSNLLHNAIQHSRRNSRVALSVLQQPAGRIQLEVADSGEGIAPEALPHIFERFYREDRSRSRATGGTGLGLAICKSIADAAGATIHLESTPGVGTRVRVTFIPA